jgi:predicted PhzF superfamily epimerase YddE/YHI9
VVFDSRSGALTVSRDGDLLTLDFPIDIPKCAEPPAVLAQALGAEPREVLAAADWLVRLGSAADVRALAPDMQLLRQLDRRGVIVTAEGGECDFVSRFFAPKQGIDEDPVTGSAHTILVPYWAERLNREKLHARQLSPRGGELFCECAPERVFISGRAVPYLEGKISLPQF